MIEDTITTAFTEDGSVSLVSGACGELYHNRAGAFAEALHDYAEVALMVWAVLYGEKLPAQFDVLDCCFGLGYNSLALAQELPAEVSLDVVAIELDERAIAFVPQVLAQSCFARLRLDGLGEEQAKTLGRFQKTAIERKNQNSAGTKSFFNFDLIQSCLRAYLRDPKNKEARLYDLIVHDPFSPRKMPELWTIDLFQAYKDRLKDNGLIITYSSAPAVRGALLDLGFSVYRTPAVGGKFGGTLAVKGDVLESHMLSGLLSQRITRPTDQELVVLAKSSRVPYRDPSLSADREEIFAARLMEQENFAGSASSTATMSPQ
jgi:tRNA U34 5-methylaminomethyl-2-thiouridine-forming methyltransferase MnmC